jgi:hypothetical protein
MTVEQNRSPRRLVLSRKCLSTCLIFCAAWIACLLLPLPTWDVGGRTILVPCALLDVYIRLYWEYTWGNSPRLVEGFIYFSVIHLAFAALVTTLVVLRLGRARAKHDR